MLWLRDMWYQWRCGFTLLLLLALAGLGAGVIGAFLAAGMSFLHVIGEEDVFAWWCGISLLLLPHVIGGMIPHIRNHLRDVKTPSALSRYMERLKAKGVISH